MMNLDNDTINAEQQNSNNTETKKSAFKDEMIAKHLASAAVGMVAGAGATYAAEQLVNSDKLNVKPAEEETQNQETTTGTADLPTEPAKPTVEERLSALEEKERIREEREHEQLTHKHIIPKPKPEPEPEPKPDPDPTPTPKPDNDFFKEHKVEISSSERHSFDNGETAYTYDGRVDGHVARFIDYEGDGRIDEAIIDYNDDISVDDNEHVDLRPYNITAQQMEEHHVSTPEHEVTVLAVQHDVDLLGETVDVAMVAEDGEIKTYVDAMHNGEVDVVFWDRNHNGECESDEIEYVGDAHIPMPTEADIKGDVAIITNDVTEDYINNGDVTVYDA